MFGYRIFSKKQLTVYFLSAAVLLLVFMTAVRGVTPNETSASKRLLPIYAVGRQEDDKTISISFDAAWGAGEMRKDSQRFCGEVFYK